MGIRVRIEIFNNEDCADITMEVVDKDTDRVDRLGELIGYAVNATESVVIHSGGSLIDGILSTLNERFRRSVET